MSTISGKQQDRISPMALVTTTFVRILFIKNQSIFFRYPPQSEKLREGSLINVFKKKIGFADVHLFFDLTQYFFKDRNLILGQ